ncbi:MAG TPA: sigma-70 factor domain-containing protein, partial [Candidatus Saccharimonadales bacterium]|nr:sigma-70 factor domain-containing protein [Candidatus Saccharimonadales bacterium]
MTMHQSEQYNDTDELSGESYAPERGANIHGATLNPYKDYLSQIGKVKLLNAAQEVELAQRIEAGLFAAHKLEVDDTEGYDPAELAEIVADG